MQPYVLNVLSVTISVIYSEIVVNFHDKLLIVNILTFQYASILRPPSKRNEEGEDEIDLIEWRQVYCLLD